MVENATELDVDTQCPHKSPSDPMLVERVSQELDVRLGWGG